MTVHEFKVSIDDGDGTQEAEDVPDWTAVIWTAVSGMFDQWEIGVDYVRSIEANGMVRYVPAEPPKVCGMDFAGPFGYVTPELAAWVVEPEPEDWHPCTPVACSDDAPMEIVAINRHDAEGRPIPNDANRDY